MVLSRAEVCGVGGVTVGKAGGRRERRSTVQATRVGAKKADCNGWVGLGCLPPVGWLAGRPRRDDRWNCRTGLQYVVTGDLRAEEGKTKNEDTNG